VERVEAEAILDGDREAALGLLMGLGELVEANRRLEARVSELERRLGRNSRNSSTPPSQDPPGAPERKRPGLEGRDPGGQPGHPGHGRRFVPVERVDEVVEHWPGRCGCGHLFSETERDPVGAPARHQVVELPPIAVLVFEHWLHRLRCPGCGATARAVLPAGVPSGSFGPRLEAAVATLSVRNRVSRRDLVELMGELFGCELSSGTVDAIVQRTGEALAAPYQDLLGYIRGAPAVNIDETGWRRGGAKRTLWGAFTSRAALLRIAPDRHERELTALLGDQFAGTCCSDRWWAYNSREPEKRQVCWSHLVRDFTSHAEGMAAQKAFGEAGLLITERLFKAWHQFQHDGDRAALKRHLAPLKRELRTLLQQAARKNAKTRYHRSFANNLLKIWPALWTFTAVPGVEPTNNAAERGLRGAVIYRKLSFGSQSEQGEQTIERLLSVSQTCRLQHRSLFAYLTDLLTAKARGDPTPLLA
jgi:transposase